MPHQTQLYDWAQRVVSRCPELPRSSADARAAWSRGLVLAHACGLSAVALALATTRGPAVNTVRQRLRESYQPADARAGRERTELEPAACCGPLVRWVTGGWAAQRVALALDVTNLADRFHVLTAAVVYRGCGLPVAGAILPAGTTDPWNPHWAWLLDQVATARGTGWTVLVLTDRGLESAELWWRWAGWPRSSRVRRRGRRSGGGPAADAPAGPGQAGSDRGRVAAGRGGHRPVRPRAVAGCRHDPTHHRGRGATRHHLPLNAP